MHTVAFWHQKNETRVKQIWTKPTTKAQPRSASLQLTNRHEMLQVKNAYCYLPLGFFCQGDSDYTPNCHKRLTHSPRWCRREKLVMPTWSGKTSEKRLQWVRSGGLDLEVRGFQSGPLAVTLVGMWMAACYGTCTDMRVLKSTAHRFPRRCGVQSCRKRILQVLSVDSF